MTDTAQPFFSIITPTFNSGPKLDSTIQSVLAQDANLFEYIVMDGASTDGTPERLQGYGERLRWKSEPDSGVYDAMNKGLALAQGRYIYFLGPVTFSGRTFFPALPHDCRSVLSFSHTAMFSCIRSIKSSMAGTIAGNSAVSIFAINPCFAHAIYSRGSVSLTCATRFFRIMFLTCDAIAMRTF